MEAARTHFLAALAWVALSPVPASAEGIASAGQALILAAQQRWQSSPHGPLLSRILPPSKSPSELPEPESKGAGLLTRYCVQCHHLPSPAMHHPEKWPRIVDRMVLRMRGQGNMGSLMKDMMENVSAPNEEEIHVLNSYLRKHAQKPLNAADYPDLATAGWAFRNACSQCHALPDPRSHAATEWPKIVTRMERNMAWMNRVVGSKPDPRQPQLRPEEIVAYLQKYAERK